MAAAGVMFEIGGIILAAAMNYEMLIIGRCFLGVAVSTQSPLSSVEAAPPCMLAYQQLVYPYNRLNCVRVACRSPLPVCQSQCTIGRA